LLAHAESDIGKVRETNEDSFIAIPPLFVVADGMGGHVAGEIASRLAIDTIREHFSLHAIAAGPDVLLRQAVNDANSLIYRLAQEKTECAGMGTTVTAVYVADEKIYWSHVGDSRLYLLRGDVFTQITEDHSLVGELMRSGSIDKEQAFSHPQRNILTRAVGTDEHISVDSGVAEWSVGDKLLLCTDGLTNLVRDEEILAVIASRAGGESLVHDLVMRANNSGGFDNITLILVQYDEP